MLSRREMRIWRLWGIKSSREVVEQKEKGNVKSAEKNFKWGRGSNIQYPLISRLRGITLRQRKWKMEGKIKSLWNCTILGFKCFFLTISHARHMTKIKSKNNLNSVINDFEFREAHILSQIHMHSLEWLGSAFAPKIDVFHVISFSSKTILRRKSMKQ